MSQRDVPGPAEPLPDGEVAHAAGGGLAPERELQQRLFTSADARAGIAAFAEKRAPRIEGR